MSILPSGRTLTAAALIAVAGPALAQGTVAPVNQPGTQPSSSNAAPGAQGQPSGAPRPHDNPTTSGQTPRQGTVTDAEQPGRVHRGTKEIAPAAPPSPGTPNVGDGTAGEAAGPGAGRSGSGGSGNAPGPGS